MDEPDPEDCCYAGEAVLSRASLGDGWAAVTSHRMLAYDPTAEGRRFESVHRPNVSRIDLDTRGDRRWLRWALRAVAYGGVALVAGVGLRASNFAATLSVDAGTGAAPVGGILSVVDLLAAGLAALATLALVAGGLLLFVAGLLAVRYARSRRSTLLVDRFGDDPVRIAADRTEGERAAATLSDALDGTG